MMCTEGILAFIGWSVDRFGDWWEQNFPPIFKTEICLLKSWWEGSRRKKRRANRTKKTKKIKGGWGGGGELKTDT